MSRPLILLIAVIVVIVGGAFLLAGRSGEKPVTHVEKVVPLGNLQN